MSEQNLQIVRKGFEAYSRGDVAALVELIDRDVVVTQLPDQPDPQTYRGPEGLLQAVAEWTEFWDDYSYEIRDMRDIDDHVLVSAVQRGRGKGSGIPMEARICFLFTLREGKLVRLQMFPSEEQALDAVS